MIPSCDFRHHRLGAQRYTLTALVMLLAGLTLGLLAFLGVLSDGSSPERGVSAGSVDAGEPGGIAPSHGLSRTGTPLPGTEGGRALLRGEVVAAESGDPMEGIEVRLRESDHGTRTDERGAFRLEGLQPGDSQIEVLGSYPWAVAPQAVHLSAGREVFVRFELSPSFRLAVDVLEAGPRDTDTVQARVHLAGAEVALLTPGDGPPPEAQDSAGTVLLSVVSDATGRCELVGIPAGTWLLRVRSNEHVDYHRLLEFDPTALRKMPHLRDRRLRAELHRRGPELSGVVLDPEGRPVSGALVCVVPGGVAAESTLDGTRRSSRAGALVPCPATAVTAASGRFCVPMLAPPAEQHLVVCPGRQDLVPAVAIAATGLSFSASGECIVRLPAASEVSVEVVDAQGARADGIVALTDGRVRFDLQHDSRLAGVPGIAHWTVGSNEPGAVRLHLPPGGYKAYFMPTGDRPIAYAFYLEHERLEPLSVRFELEN